jgi:hypothetical protein
MLTVVTYPEPIWTAAEAKAMLPSLAGASDAQVDAWLMAARIDAQWYTGRAFGEQTWEWRPWRHAYRAWGPVYGHTSRWCYEPLTFTLPLPPLVDVNWIKYRNTAGDLQTLDPATYVVSGVGGEGFITLASGSSWPIVGDLPEPVTIRFTAGAWEPEGLIPEPVKQAILLKAAALQTGVGGASGALRSRSIEGLGAETYDTGTSSRGGEYSCSAADMLLAPYRVFA